VRRNNTGIYFYEFSIAFGYIDPYTHTHIHFYIDFYKYPFAFFYLYPDSNRNPYRNIHTHSFPFSYFFKLFHAYFFTNFDLF